MHLLHYKLVTLPKYPCVNVLFGQLKTTTQPDSEQWCKCPPFFLQLFIGLFSCVAICILYRYIIYFYFNFKFLVEMFNFCFYLSRFFRINFYFYSSRRIIYLCVKCNVTIAESALKLLRVLEGHGAPLMSCCFAATANLLASGSVLLS